MRVLYIDNSVRSHNAELHEDFVKFMDEKKICNIIPYGKNLGATFSNAISPKDDSISTQMDQILLRYKPDAILTYNKNGSSYSDLRDNINLYKWVEEEIAKINLPKFHITTDYCRSGFRAEQAKWFEDLGYTAAIFRHRESLRYPCEIESFWLPFSVNASLYSKANKRRYLSRKKKVAFLGTAFQYEDLYANRVAAIRALKKADLMAMSRVVNKKTGQTQMILGDGYQKFLSKHMFGLTCGGTCNYMTAKYFQIPALGSMLICSDTNGLDMFPKDTYIKYSIENIDRLCSEVEYYTKNRREAEERAVALSRYVLRNHNNKIRANELVSFMKSHC